MEKEKKVIDVVLGDILGKIAVWFVSTAFIMWGWNTLAPHLNAPLFDYWNVFAIRMGLSYLMAIIWQKKIK